MNAAMHMMQAINKVAKWRAMFASWQLGTRSIYDPECAAVKDHREVTIVMRAELSALTQLLIQHKICTIEELQQAVAVEAEALDKAYERRFKGMRATEDGIDIFDIPQAQKMMKEEHWKP